MFVLKIIYSVILEKMCISFYILRIMEQSRYAFYNTCEDAHDTESTLIDSWTVSTHDCLKATAHHTSSLSGSQTDTVGDNITL